MAVYVNDGALIHWYFAGRDLCDEYVTGDTVMDATMGDTSEVTCTECIEMIHA